MNWGQKVLCASGYCFCWHYSGSVLITVSVLGHGNKHFKTDNTCCVAKNAMQTHDGVQVNVSQSAWYHSRLLKQERQACILAFATVLAALTTHWAYPILTNRMMFITAYIICDTSLSRWSTYHILTAYCGSCIRGVVYLGVMYQGGSLPGVCTRGGFSPSGFD